MVYRGPDAEGFETSGEWHLGHRRLSILDPSPRANQPFASRDGRYRIVYNGEIYNFRDCARRHGIELRTSCDTELLVELYGLRGPAMLEELNGMFAFVIVDRDSDEIFVARDRLGIKPLFWMEGAHGRLFSSEVAPLLALTGEDAFDERAIRQYRKLRTFFRGRTLYEAVKSFPPGHCWHDGRLHRYWDLPEGEREIPSDEELRFLVEDAVRIRLMSDVPVGSYLSGGVDSTIVAGLSHRPDTWTVGYPNSNEFPWARLAAERFQSRHHEELLDLADFKDSVREQLKRRREPLSVPNEVLLYRMTQQVKGLNTVVLSGEGADELFFGYDRIFRWAAEQEFFDLAEFSRRYAYGSHEDLDIVQEALEPHLSPGRRCIDVVARFFQLDHLHGLLRRLDFATMSASVEARVPFVDHRLVEAMAGVPFDRRMRDGVVKAPLKRIFAHMLPREIVERKKIGFPVPLADVFGPDEPGSTPMDRWLTFNLQAMGIAVEG